MAHRQPSNGWNPYVWLCYVGKCKTAGSKKARGRGFLTRDQRARFSIMVDPTEPELQQTRVRSAIMERWRFDFKEPFERAVFPILQRSADGISRLAGTGFFIAPDGIFVSAAHVFEVAVLPEDGFWAAYRDDSDQVIEVEFEEIWTRPNGRDLAIGQANMSGIDHPLLSIMELLPEIHEVIGAFVFAHTLVHEPELQGDGLTQHVVHRGHWEQGNVEEVSREGMRNAPGQAFMSSIFAEGRSSGAPVFNSNGFVAGVVSSGLAPEDGLPYSFASSICGIGELEFRGASIRERREGLPNEPVTRLSRIA